MNKSRIVDLYCKAGGASMGYHLAGFEVIGVDIEPQKNYPFELFECLPNNSKFRPTPNELEYHLGNFSEGRFMWMLKNPVFFETNSFSYRGSQGFFNVDDNLIKGELK